MYTVLMQRKRESCFGQISISILLISRGLVERVTLLCRDFEQGLRLAIYNFGVVF